MTVSTAHLAYGRTRIPLELEPGLAEWCVITPESEPADPKPHDSFVEACRNPVGCAPLRACVRPGDRVAVVTADGTRPVPNHRLIPWLLEELPVPPENVTVILGTGSHRPNTDAEIDAMFGEATARSVRIVNHDAYDPDQNVRVGTVGSGVPVLFNKAYVEADRRIALGFIEPHFAAGFSGGAKAIAPGVASIDTIFHLHNYGILADPGSTWGRLDGNPLHELIAEMAAFCPPDFLVNVTLNRDKAITGFFLGDYRDAHRAGCERVRAYAMAPVPHTFPIVVTSNSGYPLDQNLYQSVKGMSAAARIVEDGGLILMASECSDGVPDHGHFGTMLREGESVQHIDRDLRNLATPVLDQWQVQLLIQILQHCEVGLFSGLAPEVTAACKLTPVQDIQCELEQRIAAAGKGIPIAVLPEGPLSIPYVA